MNWTKIWHFLQGTETDEPASELGPLPKSQSAAEPEPGPGSASEWQQEAAKGFIEGTKVDTSRPGLKVIRRTWGWWVYGLFVFALFHKKGTELLNPAGIFGMVLVGLVISVANYVQTRWPKQTMGVFLVIFAIMLVLAVVYTILSETA